MQSLPFEGISMDIRCAGTTGMHMIVLSVEELEHVFTEELNDFVYSALLLQSLPFEGISMGRLCAYTTVVHITASIVEELGYVFTGGRDITVLIVEELEYVSTRSKKHSVHCANQAGKARLGLVKAAAWGVGA